MVGDYVGQIASAMVNDLDYPISVSEGGPDTIAIDGADFATIEVDLMWTGELITDAGGATTVSYSDDLLDFTGAGVTFQGSRGSGGSVGGSGGGGTGGGGTADCTVVVPATAMVVTGGSEQAQSNVDILVCPGGGLDGGGNNMNVYALGGAGVNVAGDNNALWAETRVSSTLMGTNNTAYVETGAAVVVSGSNSESVQCGAVTIDLTSLASPCG